MKRWAASQRGPQWTPGGIAVGGLAQAAARVLVPAGDWLAHHDAGSAKQPHPPTAWDAARGRRLAVGAGLLATGALVFTARSFARSRAGQVTSRYTQALEQLGCEELDVRIAGIRALERVARDSPRDHPAVMGTLAAFIRERSGGQRPSPACGGKARERSPQPDVQAAITVVGRRLTECDLGPIDLAGADLGGVRLTGANLDGSDLTGVDLTDADLTGAVLAHAVLARADLLAAKLVRADLTGADLGGARLTGANLDGADLTGADLTDADLTGTDLAGAELTRAELTGALWPQGRPVPEGWKRHPGSGQLIAAGTGAETVGKPGEPAASLS